MDHSGEITVLALGIAQVAPPTVYTVASTITGALGLLITSSNNASNILFAPLQETARPGRTGGAGRGLFSGPVSLSVSW
jgi:lactate permease